MFLLNVMEDLNYVNLISIVVLYEIFGGGGNKNEKHGH